MQFSVLLPFTFPRRCNVLLLSLPYLPRHRLYANSKAFLLLIRIAGLRYPLFLHRTYANPRPPARYSFLSISFL
jgi:hypothetical protein